MRRIDSCITEKNTNKEISSPECHERKVIWIWRGNRYEKSYYKKSSEVCSGIYHGPENIMDREVSSITTDSRKIEKDSLFVPIVGERVDAHRFIEDVMSKGHL